MKFEDNNLILQPHEVRITGFPAVIPVSEAAERAKSVFEKIVSLRRENASLSGQTGTSERALWRQNEHDLNILDIMYLQFSRHVSVERVSEGGIEEIEAFLKDC